MTALAHIRPQPLRTETFEAFALAGNGALIPLDNFPTLLECIEHGAMRTPHKGKFVVRRCTDGDVTLHIYAVRQRSTPTYVYRDHAYHREHRMYAEHLHDVLLPGGAA